MNKKYKTSDDRLLLDLKDIKKKIRKLERNLKESKEIVEGLRVNEGLFYNPEILSWLSDLFTPYPMDNKKHEDFNSFCLLCDDIRYGACEEFKRFKPFIFKLIKIRKKLGQNYIPTRYTTSIIEELNKYYTNIKCSKCKDTQTCNEYNTHHPHPEECINWEKLRKLKMIDNY